MNRKKLIQVAYLLAIETAFSKILSIRKIHEECLEDDIELSELVDQDRIEALYIELNQRSDLKQLSIASKGEIDLEAVRRILPEASSDELDFIEVLLRDEMNEKNITKEFVYEQGVKFYNAALKRQKTRGQMMLEKYLKQEAFKKAVLKDQFLRKIPLSSIDQIAEASIYQNFDLRMSKLYKN